MSATRAPIVYLGDTSLTGAASYLAGVMTWAGRTFDYLPSHQAATESDLAGRRLFILSDYPARLLTPDAQRQLVDAVSAGAGLWMIGGWESFCGQGGDWAGTPVAGALPVEIATTDDRVNCDQPALVSCLASGDGADHPVTAGLPWAHRPPTVGGFNRFSVKPGGALLLEIVRARVSHRLEASQGCDPVFEFTLAERAPLLAVGQHGAGRTAALATDVAPHWVGGWVDWGPQRVKAQAPSAGDIEVGSDYAKFLAQVVTWLLGEK